MTHQTVAELASGTRSRAIAAGLDPYEFDEVLGVLEDPDQWPSALRAAAARHREAAERAERAGRVQTAATAYRNASLWSYFAQAWPAADPSGYHDAAQTQWKSISLREPRARQLEGESFRAVLRHPISVAEAGPVVIVLSGLDGAKEEQIAVADALLARDVSTVVVDGPAQGELTTVQPFVADFSTVVSAVIDQLQAGADESWRPSVVGIWGSSMGGFYTVTSLAREPRLAAGVVVSGFAQAGWDVMAPYVQTLATIRAGSPEAAEAFANALDITAEVASIVAPVLVVDGGEDPLVSGPVSGEWIRDQVKDGTRIFVENGDHNVANARWRWLDDAADWVAEALSSEA